MYVIVYPFWCAYLQYLWMHDCGGVPLSDLAATMSKSVFCSFYSLYTVTFQELDDFRKSFVALLSAFQDSDCLRFSTGHGDAMMTLNMFKEKLMKMKEAGKVQYSSLRVDISVVCLSFHWLCSAWFRIWRLFRNCLREAFSASLN